MSPPIPRIARVPLTSKQPEACPHCGGRNLTRRGTRRKKLEIVQLWRCAACKRTFTPGPAALRNKTYPLRMILAALTDYNPGYTLEETARGNVAGLQHEGAGSCSAAGIARASW
jgi:transposase-like protein